LILTGLEWFTDVKTTVIYDWRWYSAFAATLIVLLTSLYMALRREPERLEIGGSWPNQAWHMICGAIGFTALTGFAVFSGVPILLHFAGNAPGEITVTVERK
jgi:hypothetical protein